MDAQPIMTPFEWDRQRLNMRNREAVLTMWTGLAAIFSLLLTCFLGSFWRSNTRTTYSVSVMVLLLILSVILFFTAAKRDERWYVVCSLINHAGIGLAVLILLDVLGLEIRLRQLAMSGLPAAAILFGVVMIYVGMEDENRNKLLYGGAAVFGLALLVSLYQFYTQRTEFWLCTAVCALLSCVTLGALIWAAAAPEQRSIYRALAVASFGVYLLLAAAAIIAFALAILSGSGRNSKSTKKLFNMKKRNTSSGIGSVNGASVGSGAAASSGSALASGFGTGYTTRRRTYIPSYFWYYGLYHGSNRSRSIRDASAPLTEEEWQADNRRLQRRRRIVFCAVAVVVILVIVLAVVLGRG